MSLPDPDDGPLPFPDASGQGVRIAVIDSGVHAGHPHIGVPVAGGASVTAEGVDEGDGVWVDRLGHGTAVMAAIQEKAPGADYFAVKVFHDSLRASTAGLLRAIGWCIERRMDVVNLSLGATNAGGARAFAEVADWAAESGTLLIAAREANDTPCYPGCLPTVIGVGLDWDLPRHRYRWELAEEVGVFFASGYPRSAPGVPRTRNLYGVSFAVANMSGVVARALEVEGGKVHRVRQALMRSAGPV
jgi:subtilisin family serine protease